jgi:putative MATE family efflux protein
MPMKFMESRSAEENYRWMIDTPVRKLVLTLSTPTVISMLVTSFYSMTDTIFVSHLGTTASAAVGVVFSLMGIIQAIGITFGQGSGNVVARLLGAQDNRQADRVFSTAFFSSLGLAFCLTVFGLSDLMGLVRFLGSTQTIEPLAASYASIILVGAPWMTVCYTMNNNLRSEGKAFLAMIGMGSGAIINVLLDPLFIFAFGLGIEGAALATVTSQFIGFSILLSHFLLHRSNLHLSVRNVRFSAKIYGDMFRVGVPSLIRNLTRTLATICLNVFAAPFGDAAIAAMSITARVMQFFNSALIGFGQGFQPVAGFSWGARRYDRLKEAFRFCSRVGIRSFALLGALNFVAAPLVMRLFIDDGEVIAIGTVALRMQCALMPVFAFNTLGGMLMQCTAHGLKSSFLAVLRQGLFFVPLVMVLPPLTGIWGIQLAQPIADVLTFAVTAVVVRPFLAELDEDAAIPA